MRVSPSRNCPAQPEHHGVAGGGYEIAFHANTGSLWSVGTDNKGAWNLGMNGATSPAIES
jgi:hypothetical protein